MRFCQLGSSARSEEIQMDPRRSALQRLGSICSWWCKTQARAIEHPAAIEQPLQSTLRFDCEDPAWLQHLAIHGYAVVGGILGQSELEHAEHLLWDFLAAEAAWDRARPETWTDESFAKMGQPLRGLINGRGVGQSDVSWFVRTRPEVQRVFSKIWRTSELLTSFDGLNVFRPWHLGKTVGGWFHVDQGRLVVGRSCVQGFVSLTDQDLGTGGLMLVPGSHLFHDEVCEVAKDDLDYIEPPASHRLLALPKHLVSCRAGDLVLWDSRCLHCNSPAVAEPTADSSKLLRALAYVCMTPKEWASERTLQDRRKGYSIRVTTSHWPHRHVMGFGWSKAGPLSLQEATPERLALIG